MIDLSLIEWPTHRVHLPSVDSTNTYLKEQLRSGSLPPAATLVVADRQTAGRGRGEAQWHSDGGSLTFSIALRAADAAGGDLKTTRLGLLPLIVAMAISEAIEPLVDSPVQIKWPNDVLLAERKVCGVLIESIRGEIGIDVIIGIGINCGPVPHVEGRLRYPATSVAEHLVQLLPAGRSLRQEVLAAVCRQLADALARPWSPETWVAIYERYSYLAGRMVSVDDGERTLRGRCLGVDDAGGLIVQSGDRLHTVLSGQVTPIEWSD